jgi:Xaa-Pro aminopeptidase
MRYNPIVNKFFIDNRKALINNIKSNSIVLVFSSDEYHRNGDQFFPFRQNSDLYHLCGINQEQSILMLNLFENSVEEILFIKHIDNLQRIWHGEKLEKVQAQDISGINRVEWLEEFDKVFLKSMEKVNTIYYIETPNSVSFDNMPTSNTRRINTLKKEFPEKTFESINDILTERRLVKQEAELLQINKAVEITKEAYAKLLRETKPNIKEYEVEAMITYEFIRNGAEGHAYSPIVASGKNACILHYVDNDKLMKDGDLLLLDFGAEYGNYAADCSRTIPINGKFTERQKECYNAVLDVYNRAQKLYVPGNTIDAINEQVGEWMQQKMIELGLFTQEDIDNHTEEIPLYKKYFMHGTAHFIGLDVHDVGSKQTVFKEGMLLSCEPAIYIEEEEIGIRIETDIIVGEKPIDLMADFPVTVEEIEAEMNM